MSSEARKELRQYVRKRRRALPSSELERNNRLIMGHLLAIGRLERARVIMGYLAFDNEVDVWPYLDTCLKQGKVVLLPRVEKAQNALVAVRFTGAEYMRTGDYGIPEPSGDPFPPLDIEAVIVPGVAFDARGYRLGYGKGYYDRFLPLLGPGCFICGVAHSLQVVDDVMPHPRDFRIPYLVTELGGQACNFCNFGENKKMR